MPCRSGSKRCKRSPGTTTSHSRGDRKGQRSIRINQAYRAIYEERSLEKFALQLGVSRANLSDIETQLVHLTHYTIRCAMLGSPSRRWVVARRRVIPR